MCPAVPKCNPKGNEYKSFKSIQTHARNVLEVMNYKTQNNSDLYTQIQMYIGKKWKSELLQEWNMRETLSPHNSMSIQVESGISDKPYNKITTAVNRSMGWRIFPTHQSKFNARMAIRPQTARIMDVQLKQESNNNHEPRKQGKFTVWYCEEREIIPQCLDRVVNKNKYVFMPIWRNMIWFQIGGDKATKGGFSESIALIGATLSAKDSMISLYIPGNACESSSNIIKCHRKMNYPKGQIWQSMSKRPALVSIMMFNVSPRGVLNSRMVKTCLCMISPSKQSKLNEINAENQNIILNNPNMHVNNNYSQCSIDLSKFDNSWKLNKSQQKQILGNWQTGLIEIKNFDANYDRPADLKWMTETERQGNFDPTSM